MSEDRYRTLFDSAADCLMILDLDGTILEVNRTGLPNRILFFDRLDQAVARAKRYKQKFAILYLDLTGSNWSMMSMAIRPGTNCSRWLPGD